MQSNSCTRPGAMLFATVAVVAVSSAAQAQEVAQPQLEEVVVTAERRVANVQEVALSITAVSGRQLEEARVVSFREMAAIVPSLRMETTNNVRNTGISLRGIGNSGNNPGIEYSVGVFLDGVYMPGPSAMLGDFSDLQSIEVLRGPQGTLYGRNTPVGAVNIITREPTQAPEGQITVGYGNYDQWSVKGHVGGGLGETVAARASFWVRERDGFAYNLATDSRVNDFNGLGGRLRVLWTPTDALKVNLVGYYSRVKAQGGVADMLNPTGPGGVATPAFLAATAARGYTFRNFTGGDFVVQADDVTNDLARSYGASATAQYEFADGHTLTSVSAWDVNVGAGDPYSADALPQQVVILRERGEIESFSEELRLTSPTGKFFEYIAGLYVYRQTYDFNSSFAIGRDATRLFPLPTGPLPFIEGTTQFTTADLETDSTAVFGTARFNLTDAWRVTGGARYVWEKKDAEIYHTNTVGANAAFQALFGPNLIGPVSRDEEKFTWLLSTQYEITPSIMLFANVSTGYKSGGFNARRQAPTAPVQFGPERSIDYQLGMKSEFFDRRLRVNATAFNMVLKNFQESILNPVTRSGFLTGNAGERTVKGVEGDFAAVLPEGFRLSGALTYLDAEFTDYANGPCFAGKVSNGSAPGTCSFNGLTPSNSPKWKVNLAVDHSHALTDDLTLRSRFEIQHTSSLISDAALDPRTRIGSVTLVNSSVDLISSGGWTVAVWGKNLTDRHYYQRKGVTPVTVLIGVGGTAAASGYSGYYAEPRTYGVELSYKY